MRKLLRRLRRKVSESVVRFFAPITNIYSAPSKEIFSIGRDPGGFTPKEWYQAYKHKNEEAMARGEDVDTAALCPYPGCEGHMTNGPCGGMSQNIECDKCKRKWNLITVIDCMERI